MNSLNTLKRMLASVPRSALLLAMACSAPLALGAAETGQTFKAPEDAVAALVAAASAEDTNALRIIFGPAMAEIANPDRVQASNELRAFTFALGQTNRLARESENKCVLEAGENFWPFAVTIVRRNDRWFFDTEAGKDELLSRRIGRNELATLQAVRAYVEAQREYAAQDRDGDEVLEYAQRIISTPGTKDGLYWPPELDGEISPLGPLVAQAQAKGYGSRTPAAGATPEPYHGYFFKILTRQGKSAPGGAYSYLINGNMIGGFALLAWPASYGDTGIMTFMVNQQGRVYQKDLGPKTAKTAASIQTYNPDPTWNVSPE